MIPFYYPIKTLLLYLALPQTRPTLDFCWSFRAPDVERASAAATNFDGLAKYAPSPKTSPRRWRCDFEHTTWNGSTAPPPILMGVAQYGLLQKTYQTFRASSRQLCMAFHKMRVYLSQILPHFVEGLLEAIVVRFWECDVKRTRAAATNFDAGGPMWPITKGLPETGMVRSQAQDAKRAGATELSHQMCMHFPHCPHHRCRQLVADAELGGGRGIGWKQCRLCAVWETYASAASSPHTHPLLLPYPGAISLVAMQTTPATHAAAPALLPSPRAYIGIDTSWRMRWEGEIGWVSRVMASLRVRAMSPAFWPGTFYSVEYSTMNISNWSSN
ncbi:hypothetical protein B0H10DRAFT_2189009 [Mycena sp. CBHHK59/15]|nr:hypothetical protein B0H10DRAFT_2189009 [Mycena sp. CBHHK59/15]